MKKLKHTYRLLTALTLAVCLGSCAQEDDFLKTGDKEKSVTRMSLVINTPTNETNGTDYQYAEECYIHDVTVYIFQNDGEGNDIFKEQITNPLLSGNNGFSGGGCRVYGTLTKNYAGTKVKVAVLANLEARDVEAPVLNEGDSPAELFSLIYNFTPNGGTWKFQGSESEGGIQYTPMYGVSAETTITDKAINNINISLYRAIARVDVVFGGEEEKGEGKGLKDFTVTGVTLNKYNTKGTCATDDLTRTKVPGDSGIGTEGAFFEPSIGTKVYNIDALTHPTNPVWRLYIPEYENKESNDAQLTISGHFGTQENRTYTLKFVDTNNNNAPIDIIRNNLYIFRITSIASPAEPIEHDINCSLEVEEWTSVDNYVEFN